MPTPTGTPLEPTTTSAPPPDVGVGGRRRAARQYAPRPTLDVTWPELIAAAPVAEPAADAASPRVSRGGLPWTFLSVCAGVGCAAGANALSRTGHVGGSGLFWLAIGLILVPAVARMVSPDPSGRERAATVVLVGLGLYAMKVLQDPFAFLYGDEWLHVFNLQAILSTGRIGSPNLVLPISSSYSGLELVGAALVRASGMSTFAAGVIEIGFARVLLSLTLYVTYERLARAPRVAALAALIYGVAPNYLFFSADYSYESLALPLACVAIFALVRWRDDDVPRARRREWGALLLIMAAAVIVTHHVSTLMLVLFLVAICFACWRLRGLGTAPWALTVGVIGMASAWLGLVATGTIGYLSPVVDRAVQNVVNEILLKGNTRVPFGHQTGVTPSPFEEKAVAALGVLLLALAIAIGVRVIWRERRRAPMHIILLAAALLYVVSIPFRLLPQAWEIANRAGEFLFIGGAFAAALGIVWARGRGVGALARHRTVAALAVGVMFASGVIIGWPINVRLGLPLRIVAGGRTLMPPAFVAAQWSRRYLGPSQRVIAESADGSVFFDDAHQDAYLGYFPYDNGGVLEGKQWKSWMLNPIRKQRITLLMPDRRFIAGDNIAGYFFDTVPPVVQTEQTITKFDRPGIKRLYDGGNLVIFGVRGLW